MLEQLREVNRVMHDRPAEAEQMLVGLLPPMPRPHGEEAREDGLAKKRVGALRDAAFSFGGLSLSRRLLARFLEMPEVRLLLPDVLREKQSAAKRSEVNELLVSTAKTFLSEILGAHCKVGKKRAGRMSDEDRNARAAALACLLPSKLFQSRQGRAAMRALGISYRQAKWAVAIRASLEVDRARGWKRIKTSEHKDKAHRRPYV